jgi:hypothetical protein
MNQIGSSFGRLVVIKKGDTHRFPSGKTASKWICKCSCGNEISVMWSHLTSGHTQSCGCFREEARKTISRTHGMAKTPEYNIWCAMRARVGNPNNRHFKHYGGRGIKVCEEWDKSFEKFFSDMGPRPTSRHTIERINTNGDYEPQNTKWDTYKNQQRNRRNNHIIEVDGVSKCLTEWADISGINWSTIRKRIVLGWEPKDAVFKKVR